MGFCLILVDLKILFHGEIGGGVVRGELMKMGVRSEV